MPPAARTKERSSGKTPKPADPAASTATDPPAMEETPMAAATRQVSTPELPAPDEHDAGTAGRPPDSADLIRTLGRVATLPIRVVGSVADDVASTARRPDAVVYWGGLAGLAVAGILEWPVAAAVGVGVAVANGRRRPHRPDRTD